MLAPPMTITIFTNFITIIIAIIVLTIFLRPPSQGRSGSLPSQPPSPPGRTEYTLEENLRCNVKIKYIQNLISKKNIKTDYTSKDVRKPKCLTNHHQSSPLQIEEQYLQRPTQIPPLGIQLQRGYITMKYIGKSTFHDYCRQPL